MKPEIVIEQSGPSGNIFEATANAIRALRLEGKLIEERQMLEEITVAMKADGTSYLDMLKILDKYVEVMIK